MEFLGAAGRTGVDGVDDRPKAPGAAPGDCFLGYLGEKLLPPTGDVDLEMDLGACFLLALLLLLLPKGFWKLNAKASILTGDETNVRRSKRNCMVLVCCWFIIIK